jgi:hypothetical protein
MMPDIVERAAKRQKESVQKNRAAMRRFVGQSRAEWEAA